MNKGLLWMLCTVLLFAIVPTLTIAKNNDTAYASESVSISTLTTNQEYGSLSDITASNTYLYITDADKKSVYVYSLESKTTQVRSINQKPDKITYNYASQVIYSISNKKEIRVLNDDSITYDEFLGADQTPYSFTRIYDIAQSSDDTIYALVSDGTNDYLIKKSINDSDFSIFNTIPALNDGCKLVVSLTGEKVLLLNDNTIYSIANNNYTIDTYYARPDTGTILDLDIDHRGDLYVLYQDGSISHCTQNGYTTINTNTSDIIAFALSPINDTIYLLKNNSVLYISSATVDNKHFLNPITSTPNIDINTDTVTTALQTLTIKQNTYLYKYDNLLAKLCQVQTGTMLTILEDVGEYYYVLDTSTQYNLTGYIQKSNNIEIATETLNASKYECLYDNVNLYAFPTSLKNDISSVVRVLTTLPKSLVFTSTQSNIIPNDYNNSSFVFASININNTPYTGYVDTRQLMQINNDDEIKPIFVSNATVKQQTNVYADNECEVRMTTIEKDTPVEIISTSNGISYIQWQEDDTMMHGYIKYNELNDGSFTILQLIGFFMMLIGIIVCLCMLTVIQKQKRKLSLDYEN